MKGIIISYTFFASRIYHMLLECYWSCIILFICPCVDLFLHICFFCVFAFFTLPPQGDDSSVSAQSEILSVDLRTLCHAWVICVDIGTNSRRASERERLVSVHVDCGSKYYIYCVYGHCCDTAKLSFLSFSFETTSVCLWTLFSASRMIVVNKLSKCVIKWFVSWLKRNIYTDDIKLSLRERGMSFFLSRLSLLAS